MQTSMKAFENEQYIEYGVDDVTLLRYIYKPKSTAENVPKPFIHPLRTLGGKEVTINRPHDHLWHTGLMMNMSHLNNMNFWGGGTYVQDVGYRDIGNHGVIEHCQFDRVEIDEDYFAIEEQLCWQPDEDTLWLIENRRICVEEINRSNCYWVLSHRSSLRNVSGGVLDFGSPTTHGRPNAGYGSLFWRGPRSFTGGEIIAPETHDDYMGVSMPWIAYRGKHDDGSKSRSTLLFIDDPMNPRYPNKWFVRTDPYACVSFSFMFDEPYLLPPDETLSLTYHIVIFDGAPDRDELERVAEHTLREASPVPEASLL